MQPYYEEPGITIYHGDCREVLPTIGVVNTVITDPPYGVNFDYGTSFHDSRLDYYSWLWPIIEAAEAHVPCGYIGMFQPSVRMREWATGIPREWYPIALPRVFGQWHQSQITRMTDYVVYWRMGHLDRWRAENSVQRDWFLSRDVLRNRPDHPCPRPLDMMKFLVDVLCVPTGVILDLFMGSGSTLLAAKELGRQAIGIDIEKRHCETAVNRLRQGVLDLAIGT